MQSRLSRIFIGLVVVLMVLEAAILQIEHRLRTAESHHQAAMNALGEQIVRVERYERASYLAVLGLATSDWELLLDQRRRAVQLAKRFTRANDALLGGSTTGAEASHLDATDDPELVAELRRLSELWQQMVASQVRLLRSDEYELSGDSEIARFRQISAEMLDRLEHVVTRLRDDHQARLGRLRSVHAAVPVGVLVLTLLLGLLAYRWLIVPLGRTMEDLQRSRAQIEAAREQLERRVEERTDELASANQELQRARDELEQRVEERTAELRDAHRRLVDIAHASGKAEVATNILHNVGNVLNGVNVLSQVIRERLQGPRWHGLTSAASMLEDHQHDLARFLTDDEKGKRLPEYLIRLAAHLAEEREHILERNDRLAEQIDHIKYIIQLQQEHARSVDFIEDVDVEEIIEDALDINAAGLDRHGATVIRDYQATPVASTHKHQLLQILVNLVSNAKYALADVPHSERRLVIRLAAPTADRLRIEVEDNGCGIAPDHLDRIFQHGYSTRKEGHGFGLHASVLAAEKLGGSLTATSDGVERGACFTLEFPARAPRGDG